MNERALRIAMTSYYLPSESKIGAGYMAHRLAQAMVDRGHHVTMFSPCVRPEDARYEHRHIPMAGRLRTFRWAARLRSIDFTAFDVVHAHGDNHLLGNSPPVVRTMHGSCFSEALHIKGAKERARMLALGVTEIIGSLTAEATVAVSNNTRYWYPWINEVIPNGVDLGCFAPGPKTPFPSILFVGTYGQRKRGRLLMDAFARDVRPAHPDARLWMVCSDAPSAPGVEVLGRLGDQELAERFRRAWVFCLPTAYEGFGVPYIEAMASGTAVIATRNPGSVEVLSNGRYGALAPDDRLGVLIESLLSDPSQRQALAALGSSRATRFGWERVSAKYENLYRQQLSSGSVVCSS